MKKYKLIYRITRKSVAGVIMAGIIISVALMNCRGKKQQNAWDLPTDKEMTQVFSAQKEPFEELKNHILKDTKFHYYPFIGKGYDSQYEKEMTKADKTYYAKITDSLKITNMNKTPDEGIFFECAEKGDATWGVNKGYYYKEGKIEEDDDTKIITGELAEACEKLNKNHCILYKKIEDNRYLFLRYDK